MGDKKRKISENRSLTTSGDDFSFILNSRFLRDIKDGISKFPFSNENVNYSNNEITGDDSDEDSNSNNPLKNKKRFYKCNELGCEKKFISPSLLTHTRVHTDGRP